MLKGYRTKIAGYVASILPVAGALGYQVSPETVVTVLSNHGVPVICAQIVASVAVHIFRLEADESKSEPKVEPELPPLEDFELELEEELNNA